MKLFYRVALKVCPILALIFSIIVTVATMYIEEGISPILIFVCIQVYLNWYCIYNISRNSTTMRSTERSNNSVSIPINDVYSSRNNGSARYADRCKYWYCDKCCYYTYRPTQHCGPCKKCFHYRDHHCFFIGGCVVRQNMGNFILICFYTSVACLYALMTIGTHLYENINRRVGASEIGNIPMFLNFCFPVVLTKLLINGENTDIMLVMLFDTLFSVFCMCFLYGTWKLYVCKSGKQRYYPHIAKKQDLKDIFGSYGLTNIVFPYNGLLGTHDLNEKYELKEI